MNLGCRRYNQNFSYNTIEGDIMQGWRLFFLALGFVGTGALAQDYSGVYDCVMMTSLANKVADKE